VRRSIYDIYAEILEYLSRIGESKITRIARYANLPLDRANRILNQMVELRLLRMKTSKGRRSYGITQKGYEYLEYYRRLKRLLKY